MKEDIDATWVNATCSICGKTTIKDGVIYGNVLLTQKYVDHVDCIKGILEEKKDIKEHRQKS
jgi:hypothetical protein